MFDTENSIVFKLEAALTKATELAGVDEYEDLPTNEQKQLMDLQNRLLSEHNFKPSDVHAFGQDGKFILSAACCGMS